MEEDSTSTDPIVDVPSHFLCPISLQLMRDPVAVSTGITYDRESIEKWLFSFKNTTCPVTKQPLFDPSDLTPNHTLRRLIQAWCTLNASNGIERIPTPKSQADRTQIVKLLEEAKNYPNRHVKCLLSLRSIASQSERSRKFLEEAGAVEFLVSAVTMKNSDSSSETAVEVLYNLKSSAEARLGRLMMKQDGVEIIESLVRVLRCGSQKSRAHAAVLLKSLLGAADPIRLVSLEAELFREVANVVRDKISQAACKAALKLLAEISRWGRNRIKAVQGGAVSILIELLLEIASDKRACELALTVLDQLCGCAEGRAELLKHGAGLAVVSKKIFRVSHVASEKAVRVLSSISRFSANSRVLQEMLQVGAVGKLCLVLQVDTSLKTKQKANEILKLHSRVWKNSTCIPAHLLSSYPSS